MTDILERMQSLPVVTASGSQFHQLPMSDMAELLDEIVKLREVGGGMLAALKKICEPITVAADAETVVACQDLHELICEFAFEAVSAAEKAGIPFPR